jgi:hypothetical protein
MVAVLITAQSADASIVVGAWGMSNVADGSRSSGALTFSGDWQQVSGVVGGAVRFDGAPSSGVARGTEDENPGTGDFAMSLVFTSRSIPAGAGYSGNLMQKGYSSSPGQVKLQLVPANGGTVSCRVKGGHGATFVDSNVNVDDGAWHTASCWREGTRIGLTVDGATRTEAFNAGAISNDQPVRIGNKSSAAGPSDQHFGANDCSVYLIGLNARTDATRLTPC